jgi:hypothetical protein
MQVGLAVCSSSLTALASLLQLTNEYRALQKLGRKLCFHQGVVDVSMTKRVLFKSADGATHEQAADMMMPATDRTISRSVDAWHDLKVGDG